MPSIEAARRATLADGPSDEAVVAVRRLVRVLGPTPNGAGPDTAGRQVLLDAHVDGERYVLVRVSPPTDPGRGATALSPREREIARMVAKGYPNKTIAAVLDISAWTVGTYLRRIFAKLGVGTRAAMVSRLQLMDAEPHGEVNSAKPRNRFP